METLQDALNVLKKYNFPDIGATPKDYFKIAEYLKAQLQPVPEDTDFTAWIWEVLNAWKDEGKSYVDETSFKAIAHEISERHSALIQSREGKVAGEIIAEIESCSDELELKQWGKPSIEPEEWQALKARYSPPSSER